MLVDKNSDITLVVTSCGRFDLLRLTLDSFVKCCDLPIRQLILTEDSEKSGVMDYIPEVLRESALVIENSPCLGQIKSIDLAYSHVKTKYIMHCEDDWFFYRPGFLSESKKILESDDSILQVRIHKHDYENSNLVALSDRLVLEGIAYYKIEGKWKSLSWNPGLRRLADYTEIDSYQAFCKKHDTFLDVEGSLNRHYTDAGKEAVVLENYVVDHIGDARHVLMHGEKRKKLKKRFKRLATFLAIFGLGYFLS